MPADTGAVCGCGRPVHNQHATCPTCLTKLTAALDLIGWLADQLEVSLTRQRAGGVTGASHTTATATLPWHDAAAQAADRLRRTLAGWVRTCRHELHLTGPGTPDPHDLVALAGWLTAHLGDLARHRAGHRAAVEITAAVRHAIAATDDHGPELEFTGPCPRCRRDLYRTPGETLVTCGGCGAAWDADTLRARLRRQIADRLVTAHEGAFLLCLLGHPIRQATIDTWHQRRRLVERGHVGGDPTGARLYLFADLLDLADAGRGDTRLRTSA
ncbi:MAG: hypothetical protein J2P26_08500 [Nocardiopsaceae bacterium]|nr:hypothetical protein [Nocardiopsaceae bacterium]